MKKFIIFIIFFLLGGCQTIPNHWIASISKDSFTDETTKIVIIGSFSLDNYSYLEFGKIYPFVAIKNDILYVGIRSGGDYGIPVGTVQIRIDDNPAWTITPDETPVEFVPGVPKVQGVNPEQWEAVMAGMTKIMSPYTVTSGDKACQILRQMIQGATIRYRTIGLNQAASSTGECKIDASFLESLQKIGIDPNNI